MELKLTNNNNEKLTPPIYGVLGNFGQITTLTCLI